MNLKTVSEVSPRPSEALVASGQGVTTPERKKGAYPFFTKENAKEMQLRGAKRKKELARERAVATRSRMQEVLMPHVEKMVMDSVRNGDTQGFWKAFEHAFGRAPESIEVSHEGDVTIVVRSAFVEPVVEGEVVE